MPKTKRVMRPRLEVNNSSEVYATVQEGTRPISVGFSDLAEADLLLKDAIRLHRFLGRALEFLEQKRGRK